MRCLLLAFLCVVTCASAAEKLSTEHVIILVIDGPRWTETWAEPQRQYIPVRSKKLAPQGVLFMDMANDGPTYTNAGHTAMVTGFHQEINNNGLQLPKNPTLPQILLKEKKLPKTAAWIVTSKDKLQILTDSSAKDWKHQFVCSFDCGKGGKGVGAGYRDDQTTFAKAKEVLTQHHPKFLLINFKEPDSSGHAKKWDNYLQGIRDTDTYAGEIWNLIQSDPVLKNKTALFITNDHGRHPDGHKDGFVSHGDNCDGCHKIELLALGPDFKQGAVVNGHYNQTDLAVTAAFLLGTKLPGSSGKIITELFAKPIAVENP